MSEHRRVFSPVARPSFSRRRRWVAVAAGALGAGGLIFGGLARAASPSDPVATVDVDASADVHEGWTGDELNDSGVAGSAYGEGETGPFDVSTHLAASADIRSDGANGIVDVDAAADLNVERNPDYEPAPVPDPDLDPIPPLDPDPDLDPIPDPDLDPIPPLDPDPDLDPTPLPDLISVPDPGPVVPSDPGGVVLPGIDPPDAPGTDPGERCASSRTTPRCGDAPAGGRPGNIGDPDNVGAPTEVHPASVVAGGGEDRSPAPNGGMLGGDGEQIAPAAADSPAGAVLPKTGGGLPTGALRLLGLGAVGRALLTRTGRRFRPSAVAARQ